MLRQICHAMEKYVFVLLNPTYLSFLWPIPHLRSNHPLSPFGAGCPLGYALQVVIVFLFQGCTTFVILFSYGMN
jgi:hypothetical protein